MPDDEFSDGPLPGGPCPRGSYTRPTIQVVLVRFEDLRPGDVLLREGRWEKVIAAVRGDHLEKELQIAAILGGQITDPPPAPTMYSPASLDWIENHAGREVFADANIPADVWHFVTRSYRDGTLETGMVVVLDGNYQETRPYLDLVRVQDVLPQLRDDQGRASGS